MCTDEFTEELKARARRTICDHARDAEEAASLMMCVGVHPSQADSIYATGPPTGWTESRFAAPPRALNTSGNV